MLRLVWLSVWMGALLVSLPEAGWASGRGWQESGEPSELVLLGTLAPGLSEASGAAVSRRHSDVVWIHNDSGDDPLVYAVTPTGDLLSRHRVDGARAEDWEDIALGPCLEPADGDSCLYVADTGDNQRRRSSASLYVFPEPDPREDGRTGPARRVRFRPLMGPVDIEALAVSPTGDVLLFSKGREGRIFIFHLTPAQLRIAAETGDRVDLRSSGELDIGPIRNVGQLVTGAAFAPDGAQLVVRTYQTLFFFAYRDGEIHPDGLPCRLGAVEPQGEAVDYLDADRLLLVSEKLSRFPATVYRVVCR